MEERKTTILLVEDDNDIRALTRDILSRAGYTVLEAANGCDAVRICQDAQIPSIDLLLSDVSMPNMSGPKLMRLASPLRPGMKVLFMSGHAANSSLEGIDLHGVRWMWKPFTIKEVTEKIREVLSGAP